MAGTLTFKLTLPPLVNQQFNDNGGNWQYVGADAVEESNNEKVQLIAMKRDNSTCGINFPASMLTATVMYSSQENETPEHLTIQGLHDITSNNETGSVSSASSRFRDYIGGNFSFAGGVLTIYPRGW
jgi:aerobic-type carbon monoxide dehydrogenase small subunit (CoxS/CutS family)